MPESAYERARRHSDQKIQKVLNQDTGEYEYRDENWVAPEGTDQCPSCGAHHNPEHIITEQWAGPAGLNGPKQIASSQNTAIYESTYCPSCA